MIRGSDCDGNSVADRGSGPAEFEFSPSLQTASVEGTITTREGRSVTVDMSWEGTGAVETTNNTTTFPGFTGHFTGREREAVATGTVVVDGETLVAGSTTNAAIETLEDNNISHPWAWPSDVACKHHGTVPSAARASVKHRSDLRRCPKGQG